jgi:hypothetical protein
MKVAEGKTKQSQPREDDPQIVLRRILLNSLMKAPVPKEKVIASAKRQFGFRREDVLRAAIWWNWSRRYVTERCTGASQTYWSPCRIGTMGGQMTDFTSLGRVSLRFGLQTLCATKGDRK